MFRTTKATISGMKTPAQLSQSALRTGSTVTALATLFFCWSASAQPTQANPPANTINIISSDPADKAVAPAAAAPAASTIYRQVTPDGATVYSDQPLKGAKVERALSVPAPIKGNSWTSDNAMGTAKAESQPTVIRRGSDNGDSGPQRTREDAQTDVTRAEMLLEDAKRRLADGAVPEPGERTGTVSGKSRLNQNYMARQDALERDVERARLNLERAKNERNNMR